MKRKIVRQYTHQIISSIIGYKSGGTLWTPPIMSEQRVVNAARLVHSHVQEELKSNTFWKVEALKHHIQQLNDELDELLYSLESHNE